MAERGWKGTMGEGAGVSGGGLIMMDLQGHWRERWAEDAC